MAGCKQWQPASWRHSREAWPEIIMQSELLFRRLWSNAQAEGQINKLKLVKRQMYGRGNLDLLQARVIATGR